MDKIYQLALISAGVVVGSLIASAIRKGLGWQGYRIIRSPGGAPKAKKNIFVGPKSFTG